MGFDYDQLKAKSEGEGSFWASYSDLFMVLSLVFLLLYVVAGLRSGTHSVNQLLEYKELKKQNADYKEQLKAYNTLKKDYLKQGATKDEMATYKKLMAKLSLLQEEAKEEKEDLRKQAQENEEKEQALNQYQQIVRNIINTNMLSAARMKRKDKVITKIDKDLEGKVQEVAQLNRVVENKQEEIEQRKAEIQEANKELDQKVAQLKEAFKQNKITKNMMQAKLKKIQVKAAEEIEKLESKTTMVEGELQSAMNQLEDAEKEIESKDQTIVSKNRDIASKNRELSKLEKKKAQAEKEIAGLRADFKEEQERAQKEFNNQLKHQRMSALERAKKIEKFRDQLAAQKKVLDDKVAQLEGDIKGKQAELAKATADANKAKQAAKNLAAANRGLASDLKDAKAKLEAKKKLVKKIADNLNKAGVKASVDGKSGDVVLSFGEEYFDTGKANLKENMKKTLQKFMPTYSSSLLSDKETASKIKSVEIVGFASPTYKGKYVDPVSLKAMDRNAANYNLDLSYYRARAIYEYIFDKKNMVYRYQKDILPLVKVSGRSYFAEGADRKVASSMSQKEYCRKYDCKKAQRVIIKFDLGN